MKKVKMILTNRFDPDIRVYKEAKYLVNKGFDVEILCWDREKEYKDKEFEVIDGIKIRRFYPYAKYGTGLMQLRSFVEFIKKCKEYLKNEDYQYIHCHDLDGVISGYFLMKNNAKLIFDMHEFYEVNGKMQRIRYIIRMLVNFLQNKSDYIIYVNEMQKQVMLRKNQKKLIFVPNYPDKEVYVGCEKVHSDKIRVSYIGAVRQFNELKNLIDACSEMNDVEVYIHGAGVAYKKLKDISSNYNNVFVTGKYNFTQSAELYSKTDILYALYPTNCLQYRIAYPVKFFEAIITKTPIIVNKKTVLEDFVKEHDIGFVVDGNNVEEIKGLIDYISKNRYLLDEKAKNLEKIQYDYNWNEVVKNLDKIY